MSDERLSRTETELAILAARADDLKQDIRTFAPLVTAHAKLEERVSGLQRGLDNERIERDRLEADHDRHVEAVAREFAIRDERERTRAEQSRKDQLTLRVALAGLAITFGGLIVAVLNSIGGH